MRISDWSSDVCSSDLRTEVALADSLFPVQVIDHDEIVRSQARSLTDLLRGRAGIDIGNQGGHGKLSIVFMRGAEADQVLVLIDGVRVGSVSAGLTAFQDLPVDRSEEHTSELQSLMRISYAVFCLKTKKN